MAHTSSNKETNVPKAQNGETGDEVKQQKSANSKDAIFHDFLSKGCSATTELEASPVSASLGGTSGGGGSISATSDLGTEKHVGSHFEGVPFYGPRGVCTGPGSTSRMSGTKRRNSDSFLGSSRENLPSVRPESLEDSHLSKFLRHVGRDQPRRPHGEESSFGFQQVRPISSPIISQPSTGGRTDAISSKWDRAVPVNIGHVSQYPPRAGQAMPSGYLTSQTRSRDASAGPSTVSQAAADEGSRTGVKGSGIFSSINATAGAFERSFSGVLAGFAPKSGAHISEAEFPNSPSGHKLTSAGRQMTIFYGGQAHVFDNVHPNKADIIMSLAGSNGGSWSTTYAPKLGSIRSSGEHCMPNADETGTINGYALAREPLGRSLVRVNSMHLPGSSDRIPTTTGIHQEIIVSNETKGSNQGVDTRNKERQHL